VYTFATIQEFARFRTVTYYTLKGDDAALSETDEFLARIKQVPKYDNQRNQLVKSIEYLGNHKEGAVFELFRHERICVALPPKAKYLDTDIDLRLYCHWVSNRNIILYNGGIKTTHRAQDCPNVSHHFYNAQSRTKQLIEIGIETRGQDITNLEELYIKK